MEALNQKAWKTECDTLDRSLQRDTERERQQLASREEAFRKMPFFKRGEKLEKQAEHGTAGKHFRERQEEQAS
ncbi:uncharacterized protein V6R79_021376 [Siganus canaliculatus]